MIKLYNLAVSNFSNMVKVALLEKGFDFEDIHIVPNQEAEFLDKSPLGKVPFIELKEGFLCETQAIFEFLEDCNSELPLYPVNVYDRAKARELIKICELYIEAPAHRLIGPIFTGREPEQSLIEDVRAAIQKGLAALHRIARFSPYIAGDQFGYADIFAYYTMSVASMIAMRVYDWDIYAEVDGLLEWQQMIAQRPLVKQADEAARQAMDALKKDD